MNATERFKMLLATALERVCILEAELELAQQRIDELEAEKGASNGRQYEDRGAVRHRSAHPV
jgi:hypothetical protein